MEDQLKRVGMELDRNFLLTLSFKRNLLSLCKTTTIDGKTMEVEIDPHQWNENTYKNY